MPRNVDKLKKNPAILIVEDDKDQMEFLALSALQEINKLVNHKETTLVQRRQLRSIQIVKVTDLATLEKVLGNCRELLLTILDCNIPDEKNRHPNDQLVTTNHRITGQHNSVDKIIEYFPDSPITIISSMNRFQRIVATYYKKGNGVNLSFISKSSTEKIIENMVQHLSSFLQNDQ